MLWLIVVFLKKKKLREKFKLINIFADEFRIKQILLNFVSNAVKFTNEGSITINLVIKSKNLKLTENFSEENIYKTQDYLKISIKDTGIGINNKDQKKISNTIKSKNKKQNYKNFLKKDNEKINYIVEHLNVIETNENIKEIIKIKDLDKISDSEILSNNENNVNILNDNNFDYFGDGLGLNICKCLADKLKYELKFKSSLGIGSNFSLIIPIDKEFNQNIFPENSFYLEDKNLKYFHPIFKKSEKIISKNLCYSKIFKSDEIFYENSKEIEFQKSKSFEKKNISEYLRQQYNRNSPNIDTDLIKFKNIKIVSNKNKLCGKNNVKLYFFNFIRR